VLTGSTSINDVGQIVGYAYPVTDIAFAFLRQPDGTFEWFLGDCAGPTRPANVFTSMVLNQPRGFWFEGAIPFAINNRGQIAGGCSLDIGIYHWSFLRQPDDTIIVFEPEHDIIPRSQALAMNSGGQITGILRDMSSIYRGYLREPNGSITIFDASSSGTIPTAINPRGQVTGYIDPIWGSGGHGFLRKVDGTIVLFDAPNAISTQPTGINPRGNIAGVYFDASDIAHGFLRDKHGTITTFDVPNAINTYPTGMNPRGDITGWYSDAGGVHGFVFRP
jgi:hypothetical protein